MGMSAMCPRSTPLFDIIIAEQGVDENEKKARRASSMSVELKCSFTIVERLSLSELEPHFSVTFYVAPPVAVRWCAT
jgi:hypothetical protein